MKKKFQNIVHKSISLLGILGALVIWQLLCSFRIVPAFMLPSPLRVMQVFWNTLPAMLYQARITLLEAGIGLLLAIGLAFIFTVCMDRFPLLYRIFYPLLIITQTVPVIAIAPLLVLWMGFGLAPKVVLIVIVCFFPMTIGLLDGFHSCDRDALNLLKAMGASHRQILVHGKIPQAATAFFAGLKIAVSYAIVGAVISEWLGGNEGLGVYMTRVRKAYAYDKMFAVIILITIISLITMSLVKWIEHRVTPWAQIGKTEGTTS